MKHYYKLVIILLLAICVLPLNKVLAQNKKIDSLKNVISNTLIDSIKVKLTIDLAREIHRTPNHENKDIDAATLSVDLALQNGETIYYARALNTLGLIYRFHQHYDIAAPLHVKAYQLSDSLDGYIKDKMIFANNAGVAARYMSDYETAVIYYQNALKIAEQQENLLNIEIACNGLGNVYMSIPGQEEIGVAYFERALGTAKAADNKRGIAMNYFSLSNIYDANENYKKAREYLDKLAQVNNEIGDQLGIGLTHKSFGSSYLNEGIRLDLAEEHLLKAKQIFQATNNAIQEADVNYYLAKLHFNCGEGTQAINLLNESLNTAKQLNSKGLIISISKLLFKIYNEKQEYNHALTYHMLWRDYQDSLNLNEQEIEVLALNKKYDFEKTESEIASLKKEKQINTFLLESEKNKLKTRSIILILIALLFATLFIIFFQKSQNRKFIKENAEIQAQLENQRIKQIYERSLLEAEVIAMQMKINPHFLFNSLNSIKLLIQQNENDKAINYLVHLARFNRSLLELENLATHSLADEIDLTEQYLKLETKRFNNDFSYFVSYQNLTKEDLINYSIPPLLLQPYIENAIWHGLLPSDKKNKEIKISIIKKKESLEIKIDDNGIGRQMKSLNVKRIGTGKGMGITKKRIALFNKTNDTTINFKIIDKTNGLAESIGTQVLLDIKPAVKIS